MARLPLVVVDYGMGNLKSVAKACEAAGMSPTVSGRPEEVARAHRLVLPGVGAFKDAMEALGRQGLVGPIREHLAADRPFLGICLGLQLLFEVGEEGGPSPGLGVLPGRVARFEGGGAGTGARLKVPHMGWNQVRLARPDPLFAGIADGSWFYFLHSYRAVPAPGSDVTLAETAYPAPFCSAVGRGRMRATQFHPEKSQALGLALLANFSRL